MHIAHNFPRYELIHRYKINQHNQKYNYDIYFDLLSAQISSENIYLWIGQNDAYIKSLEEKICLRV